MNTACLPSISPLASCTAGPIRVLYCDTDRMGFVYYSKYLVWFEIGRTTLLRQLGSTYRDWEDVEGVYLPVRKCTVDYYNPAHYDDSVYIDTAITRLTRASITIHYRIHKDEGEQVLAEGHTTHAFVDANGRILRIAERLLPQFF